MLVNPQPLAFDFAGAQTFEDILEAARKLMNLGVKEVVVSMGGDGALFIGKDRVFHSPGLKVPVQSTVAPEIPWWLVLYMDI